MNAFRKPFERISTIQGKALLLLAPPVTAICAYQIVRRQSWMPESLGVVLDVAAAAVVVLLTLVLLQGLRQLVLQPLQRVRAQFERIGSGDYSVPVQTRRTDEIGDMLRALEQMRLSLAAATAAREATERKHREILDRSLYGFYQRTLDGRLLAANPALAGILGFDAVDALLADPAGIERMYLDPAQPREFARLVEAHGVASGFESAIRRRDGRVVWVSEVGRRVTDESGRSYMEGFIDDITSRKEAEQIKADFVSFVTHQLRTPLAGIRWMLELAEQGQLDEETATCVADARLSAERLIALVNDLLDVTRLESGRLHTTAEPTTITDVTREVLTEIAPLAASRHLEVRVSDDRVPPVLIDPHLARQAVLNVLSNAIKYTPQGGAIHISATAGDDEVRWSVRDTGIGVPPSAQARLFEKFFRADNAQIVDTEGTGLGLYLVRLIAVRAGGSASCESKEGEGSTFTITLPIARERKAVA